MPFDPVSLGVGSAISIGSSLIGWLIENGHRDAAQRILDRAQSEYGATTSDILEKVAYQELGPTAFSQIQSDPTFKQAQYAALDKLKQVGDQGGLTLEDVAAQNRADYSAQRAENAGFHRVQEAAGRSGTLGSGADIAMRLANQQGAAQRYAQTADNTAANAQARALQAIMSRGTMAGQMRQQDFGEQAQIAQAKDRIAQYNTDTINRGRTWKANAQLGLAGEQYRAAAAKANAELGKGSDIRQTLAGVGGGIGGTIAGLGEQGAFSGAAPAPAEYPTLSAPVPMAADPEPLAPEPDSRPLGPYAALYPRRRVS